MKIICGGETGVVKIVEPETNKILSKIGQQTREGGILSMVWAEPTIEAEVS